LFIAAIALANDKINKHEGISLYRDMPFCCYIYNNALQISKNAKAFLHRTPWCNSYFTGGYPNI
ncbi:MAG: hypothetical protein RR415_03750, partial [Ruthenibacterium sp.]